MNRRAFVRVAAGVAASAPVLGACYGFAEAVNFAVVRHELTVRDLPPQFDNTQVAFLTDIHLGPYLSEQVLASVVRTTRMLNPDLILLGGDYTLHEDRYAGPCFELLAGLSAPLGVYGVLGNHDYVNGLASIRRGMRQAHIEELRNCGVWLKRGSDRVRLAGVDDLWRGRPDVTAAVGDVRSGEACLLLSHNPDVAETLTDRRVGLVLSGHTHGGQVVIPGYGPPIVPSRYGAKYVYGLVEAPVTQVLVSAGVGMSGLPVRANCRPEIVLITLRAPGCMSPKIPQATELAIAG